MRNRILSMLLALIMVFSLVPAFSITADAAELSDIEMPDGLVQVDSITATAVGKGFNTDIAMNQATVSFEVDMVVSFADTSSTRIMGFSSSSGYYFGLQKKAFYQAGTAPEVGAKYRINVCWTNGSAVFTVYNGETGQQISSRTFNGTNLSPSTTLNLFKIAGYSGGDCTGMSLYSCKVTLDDGTPANIVPAYDGKTGKLGLYNDSNNAFYLDETGTYTTTSGVVEMPVANVEGGVYPDTQTVTLKSATEGATIYYTTDGSAPTASSNEYTSAVRVSAKTTLRAIAVKEGMVNSAVACEEYYIAAGYDHSSHVTSTAVDTPISSGFNYDPNANKIEIDLVFGYSALNGVQRIMGFTVNEGLFWGVSNQNGNKYTNSLSNKVPFSLGDRYRYHIEMEPNSRKAVTTVFNESKGQYLATLSTSYPAVLGSSSPFYLFGVGSYRSNDTIIYSFTAKVNGVESVKLLPVYKASENCYGFLNVLNSNFIKDPNGEYTGGAASVSIAEVSFSDGSSEIKVDDKGMLYLPSHADYSALKLSGLKSGAVLSGAVPDAALSVPEDGAPLNFETIFGDMKAGETYTVRDETNTETFTMIKAGGTSSIYISGLKDEGGNSVDLSYINATQNNEASGILVRIDKKGTSTGELTLKKFAGRGNSSWQDGRTYNPYKINLGKKTELISGGGEAKKYALLNAAGETEFLEGFARDLSAKMGASSGTDYEFVDVYVDGTYIGNYFLTERVAIADKQIAINKTDYQVDGEESGSTTRVVQENGIKGMYDGTGDEGDVQPYNANKLPDCTTTENSTDDSADPALAAGIQAYQYATGAKVAENGNGGVVLEMNQAYGVYIAKEKSYFITRRGQVVTLKDPEYASKDQVQQIAAYFQGFEDALFASNGVNAAGKHYTEYVDLDAMAKHFLIDAAMLNNDFMALSFYFHIDANPADGTYTTKLIAEPVWDYGACRLGDVSTLGLPDLTNYLYLPSFNAGDSNAYHYAAQFMNKADFVAKLYEFSKEDSAFDNYWKDLNNNSYSDFIAPVSASLKMTSMLRGNSNIARGGSDFAGDLARRYDNWRQNVWSEDKNLGAEISQNWNGLKLTTYGRYSQIQWYQQGIDKPINGATSTIFTPTESGIYYAAITGENIAYLGSSKISNNLKQETLTLYTNPIAFEVHTHTNLNEIVAKEATCTEDGNIGYWICSDCKALFSDADGKYETSAEDVKIEKLGHSFTDYVSNNDASCTEDGTKTATCERCDVTDTQKDEGTKLGHSFTDYVSNNDASCTSDGTKTAKCDRCEERDTQADSGSAKGHQFGDWITQPSSCTEQGIRVRICSVCGVAETENLNLAEHEWESEYTVDKAATCTEDGSESIHCKNCDATKESRVISKLGHSFTNYVSDGNATCTADGTETATCDRCDVTNTRTDEGSALGHSFTNYVSDGNATCTADGTETATCDRCDVTNTRTDEGSKLPHTWDEGKVTTQPTYDTAGVKTYICTVCDQTKTEEIPQLTRPSYGGGSSSSSNTTTTTAKNPDGSTTTTVTNKSTGVVTETTKAKDGTTVVATTDKKGNTTVTANVPSAAINAAKGEAVTLPTTISDGDSVKITTAKATKVEILVEDVTPGTVAVIVKADGTEEIVSTSMVTENGVVLTVSGTETVKVIDNAKSFSDVPANHVFYNEIASLSAREIMVGKTEDTFDLNSSVTLNQIANVAGRIIGAVDVKDFGAGVTWGAENGLKTGNQPATRGDVLKALYIAAGSPAVEDISILSIFNDNSDIPADMVAIVAWAAQNGILKGDLSGNANLSINVTRGQACALAGRTMNTLASI